jgi:hypothetical protein
MAETDGAWWSEVEHLREGIERKRAQATEPRGFERVADAEGGRFARRQQELTTTERDRVDAELAELASPARREREPMHFEPIEAPSRTGRFDRADADRTILLQRDDEPDPGPPSEPISPSALLSLDVGWQETVRGEPKGEFTELIIPGQGVPGRPTVQIRGRGAEGRVDALLPDRARRRPSRTVSERLGPRPDRVALLALLLAVVLIITAVATADASTLAP